MTPILERVLHNIHLPKHKINIFHTYNILLLTTVGQVLDKTPSFCSNYYCFCYQEYQLCSSFIQALSRFEQVFHGVYSMLVVKKLNQPLSLPRKEEPYLLNPSELPVGTSPYFGVLVFITFFTAMHSSQMISNLLICKALLPLVVIDSFCFLETNLVSLVFL